MEITKKLNFGNIFIFLFFIIFPFGQIIRIGIIQPLDIIVALGAVWAILRKFKKPYYFKYFETFLFAAFFSWMFGAVLLRRIEILYGILYLFRLFAYFYFFIYVWNFAQKSKNNIKLLIDSLLSISVISAIFGWIQYFTYPSLRPFMVWGWDEHLFRLVGTFLDPTFLGIIIVFGLILSMNRFIDTKKKNYLIVIIFLLVSLAFTYSRASYLAFLLGMLTLGFYQKKIRQLIFALAALVVLIVALPTSGNHVLQITREFSAIARVENYQETLKIFSTSPIFGVGYDNFCLARAQDPKYLGLASHSCSGSDSSLLFILATTGVVGMIVFVYSVLRIGSSLKHNSYFVILCSSLVALLIHSSFSNSLFYPWVITWILVLLAVSIPLRSEG